MKRTLRSVAVAVVLVACGTSDTSPASSEPTSPAPAPSTSTTPAPPCACPATPAPEASVDPLRVRFLGVDGFVLERGDEAVMTVPLFTRPTMIEALTGLPVSSDAARVANSLPAAALPNVRAIVSGHAHYDHLLDAAAVMAVTPQATLYSNLSARNLLAAYAPDRNTSCLGTPTQPNVIPRSRVVAVDDPAASTVDYTNCPDEKPAGAPLAGTWVAVPGPHVRLLAVCSQHPAQIADIHYGPGDVTDEQCTPPPNMNDWKQGTTVAYLIDFLDPKTDAPLYRVYYEDAPTNTPVGHVPPSFLADKRVDLALMCVGSYDQVDGASPADALAALTPRYAIGGHWEDFFQEIGQPITPIPFLDVDGWQTKARAALPPASDHALVQNGAAVSYRVTLPQPGDTFEIVPP